MWCVNVCFRFIFPFVCDNFYFSPLFAFAAFSRFLSLVVGSFYVAVIHQQLIRAFI